MEAKRFEEMNVQNVRKGVTVRMDAVSLKNGKIGFPAMLNREGKSILLFSVPEDMPLIEGARYDVTVKEVHVTKKKTKVGTCIIAAEISAVRMVETLNVFYDAVKGCIVEQKRSGRVLIGKSKEVPVKERTVMYYDRDPNPKAESGTVFSATEFIDTEGVVRKRKINFGQTLRGFVKSWRKKRYVVSDVRAEEYRTELKTLPPCPEEI
ncbi:MAG: hypothetical protein HYT28_02845 [Parcubacteria group bacterium]|nr:hypothetical protein [Parcubacteria group bacterium]